jgi:hypothetical protein
MIIVDQCSGVFFEQAKFKNLQPQLLDAFATAISRVVSYIAFAELENRLTRV